MKLSDSDRLDSQAEPFEDTGPGRSLGEKSFNAERETLKQRSDVVEHSEYPKQNPQNNAIHESSSTRRHLTTHTPTFVQDQRHMSEVARQHRPLANRPYDDVRQKPPAQKLESLRGEFQQNRMTKMAASSNESIVKSPRLFRNARMSEARQVVFIKIHKAASSTMQNIFIRFAMARNLSLLLPRREKVTSVSEFRPTIHPQLIIPQPEGQPFDILCNHVIYNKRVIAQFVPESAARVAILREPLKQALSALEYYTKYFPYAGIRNGYMQYQNDPINGFLQHPEAFMTLSRTWPINTCFINNRMSLDLGFPTKNFENAKRDKRVRRTFITSLENDFDLMLISDYFEESLVLLKRYLSWTMKDILYVKINVAKHEPKSAWAREPVLNASAHYAFHQWNIIDIELYDHFFPLFLKKIKSEHLFFEEVRAFKDIQKRVDLFCLHDRTSELMRVQSSVWTKEFTVSKSDCELITMNEPKIVKIAREKQLERYKKYLNEEVYKSKPS